MTRSNRPDIAILMVSLALAVPAIAWADGQFLRVMPRGRAWESPMAYTYSRLEHDLAWLAIVATTGIAALLARHGRTSSRRGFARPGTMAIAVIVMVGGVVAAHRLLTGFPANSLSPNLACDLPTALRHRLTGAIIGAWVVVWLGRRGRPDWRERAALAVGWLWLANAGMILAYGLLFG